LKSQSQQREPNPPTAANSLTNNEIAKKAPTLASDRGNDPQLFELLSFFLAEELALR
jgi:hypothetical protein